MSTPVDEAHAKLLRAAGQRIRDARAAKGLSQAQLAQRIGMTRASISNLESGRQDMSLTRLAGVAQVLGLDLAAFIRPEDLPPLPPEPHTVTIRPVFEVSCRTCGDVVLDVTADRDLARETMADHIAKSLAADTGRP